MLFLLIYNNCLLIGNNLQIHCNEKCPLCRSGSVLVACLVIPNACEASSFAADPCSFRLLALLPQFRVF